MHGFPILKLESFEYYNLL